MRRLYVLYDARCGLCSSVRRWAERQPTFVELRFVSSDSPVVDELFPGMKRLAPGEELVAVDDEGGVYRDSAAWIMFMYALEDFRELAFRFAQPAFAPLARKVFAMISKNRRRVSSALGLVSDADLVAWLDRVDSPACELRR
jgi:predicted DCC family thiol-disulfide oxidoreductase YuxK